MAPTYVGDFQLVGADLRKRGLNRIGNMLVPNRWAWGRSAVRLGCKPGRRLARAVVQDRGRTAAAVPSCSPALPAPSPTTPSQPPLSTFVLPPY